MFRVKINTKSELIIITPISFDSLLLIHVDEKCINITRNVRFANVTINVTVKPPERLGLGYYKR